ncbi:hypothetical protein [Nonomuraea longicatena]
MRAVLVTLVLLATLTADVRLGMTPDAAVEVPGRWALRYAAPYKEQTWHLVSTSGGEMTLATPRKILRWDGVTWHPVPHPWRGAHLVGAASAGDTIWVAATRFADGEITATRLLTWSGGKWTVKHSTPSLVIDLAAGPRGEAWIATLPDNEGGRGDVLHWNGRRWRSFGSEAVHYLNGIAVANRDDLWAVTQSAGRALTHWNGTAWAEVPHPCTPAPSACRGLSGIGVPRLAAQPDGRAWLAAPIFADAASPKIFHWDRTRWKEVGISATWTGLRALATDPVGGVWIAANSWRRGPSLLNLRDGVWRRIAVPVRERAEQVQGVTPVPGTTRVWVHTGFAKTARVYELQAGSTG